MLRQDSTSLRLTVIVATLPYGNTIQREKFMTWEYALIGLVVGIIVGAVAMRFGKAGACPWTLYVGGRGARENLVNGHVFSEFT